MLVALIAYGVWWLRESDDKLNEASRAGQISDAYEDALQATLELEVLARKILEEPSVDLRREFSAQVYRAAGAVAFIQNNGDEEDRAVVQQVLDVYSPQLPEVMRT